MARRAVDGFLFLDKPVGMSSNAALQKVKWLYNAKKAGHAGSLDPLASGMLLICFGQYTKLSQYLLDADKRYITTAKLGEKTSTADAEGEVIETKSVKAFSEAELQTVIEQFTGEISQVPSMFSALKHNGQPLYKLARQGIEVERKARQITIHELKKHTFANNLLELEVHCSKGTYIRNLVEDIGDALGCGAHVAELRRTAIGKFYAPLMVTLDELISLQEQKAFAALDKYLHQLDVFDQCYPEVELSESLIFYLSQGQAVQVPNPLAPGFVLLKSHQGRYLGLGEVMSSGKVAPRKMISS